MKIPVNILNGETDSQAMGVERISTDLAKELPQRINYKIYSYKMPKNPLISRFFYIYLFYPFKVLYSLYTSHEIIHIYSQGYAHLAYYVPHNKLVITCCDIIPFIMADPHDFWGSCAIRHTFTGLKKARRIIAISSSTKNDLIRYLHIPEEKIIVIYPRIDEIFKGLDSKRILNIKKTQFPKRKLILYVGSYLPNKNLPAVLQAFQKAKRKMNNLTLVIVNEKNKLPSEYKTLIESLNIEKSIHFTGYVSDQKLVELYNMADVLLFPSLYEGFGLPVLEAMRCGTPVVAARNSSLQEIGDEAVLFTGNTAEELAGSIEELLSFSNHQRVQLIKKASHWEQQFTWDKTAQQTIEVYKKML